MVATEKASGFLELGIFNVAQYRARLLDDVVIAAQHNDRDVERSGKQRIERRFWHRLAIDPDIAKSGDPSMSQDAVGGTSLGVITNENRGIKGTVESLHLAPLPF